ncbi:DUF1345 domain-containing protein [Pseudonocardia sp. HH130630-07]|uniref:DUF1345 domain-containing protein n=1 Tax=Pseudonocardia sp. HH130630-07 TaxID=1690815 RepID=UPI000814DB53|nr:DUF1345 domain-containing protein [Pseudonocardia sp. HH130630-07]ANY09423.1 hypothetical protein AFB00_27850 [Pseudonocardia sp. HH130630-07]
MRAAGSDVAPRTRRPRLASDGARYVVTIVLTAVLATIYGAIAPVLRTDGAVSPGTVVTVYFGAWTAYSVVYTGLTWIALRRADGFTLVDWLAEDRIGRRRRRRTEWLAGSGGPLGALTFCAVAIAAVICVMVLRELREDPVVVGLAVLAVVASWLLIVIVYAVHYARENGRSGGLGFPGPAPPRLADYVYLSVGISTAYNSGDVTVTSTGMRSAATVHTVVAFVFNTVIVALLVSMLVTVST